MYLSKVLFLVTFLSKIITFLYTVVLKSLQYYSHKKALRRVHYFIFQLYNQIFQVIRQLD